MALIAPKIALEDGLDLSQVTTTGSLLQINLEYDDTDHTEPGDSKSKTVDFIGSPVSNFSELEKRMTAVNEHGLVKKKILDEGGGCPISEEFTVSVAFSGYWENEYEAFDVRSLRKPLVVDLKDHGLLPGLEIAIKSMLVGEVSVFLLSYKVMYGELGLPPRIKPKKDCVFYIKLIKSVHTPKEGPINFSEPNMFQRVHHEAKMLLSSGNAMYKAGNIPLAANLFKKAVIMLHKCRLADEKEEALQEKLLIKLYLNLAICYNDIKQPLKACTACNELNRLRSLWKNSRALFQNAKALRMIGQFDAAEKRLKRAMKLTPDSERMKAELDLLQKTKESCNENKLLAANFVAISKETLSKEFKDEVDKLLVSFKENVNLCRLDLPPNLNSDELSYIKEACIRGNLFVSRNENKDQSSVLDEKTDKLEANFFLDKDKDANAVIYDEKCTSKEENCPKDHLCI